MYRCLTCGSLNETYRSECKECLSVDFEGYFLNKYCQYRNKKIIYKREFTRQEKIDFIEILIRFKNKYGINKNATIQQKMV